MKMPSKRRKYNARFPAGRIKKIMQTDEQVGKVAQAVPIIISRTLELFVQSLLNSALVVTNAKNARTLSPSHMKQCIISNSRFHFLKDLVRSLPDVNTFDEDGAASVSNTAPANEESLSSFTGRRYRTANQQEKQDMENNEDKESEDSESSESEKDTVMNAEESTSDFVIDEDYGS
ncbi:dr1-associated corepressor [Thrips palmi]|uniref:Dr1-associated corepressor n=1 Tax=Thrips palmi TaxID=161013 RepID=A0A6P8YZ17_THRPL|nr:dr1-associated corepressor [Thrips palmi]